MNKIDFNDTTSEKKINTEESSKNNFLINLKELNIIEHKLENNVHEIINKSNELERLYIQQRDYKENFGIKETFHELEISLVQQEKLKDNFIKQKNLLEDQKKLRFDFKRLREDIHSLNIEIKEISNIKHLLEDYEKQIQLVNLSLDEIGSCEKKYEDKIIALKIQIKNHENKIDSLRKEGDSTSLSLSVKSLISHYDKALQDISNEADLVYKRQIEELFLDLKQQQTKHKNAYEYKNKLKNEKYEMINTLKLLDVKYKTLQNKQHQLLDIEKIGQVNNEKLAKIKDTNYDEILYNSLLEQHKTIKLEYEKILELEKNIQNIPIIKSELTFLQDSEVKYTEQKISISHQLDKNNKL
ncbi:hypothetical protein A9Q76_03770 [Arcobacter sp. 31_11_sub10_T18]|nr:hypothetical protein A9Q76_03770 [Arcobacter sp. 31_11_sub10_T18]